MTTYSRAAAPAVLACVEDLWPRLEFNAQVALEVKVVDVRRKRVTLEFNGERYEVTLGGSLFVERQFTAIMIK